MGGPYGKDFDAAYAKLRAREEERLARENPQPPEPAGGVPVAGGWSPILPDDLGGAQPLSGDEMRPKAWPSGVPITSGSQKYDEERYLKDHEELPGVAEAYRKTPEGQAEQELADARAAAAVDHPTFRQALAQASPGYVPPAGTSGAEAGPTPNPAGTAVRRGKTIPGTILTDDGQVAHLPEFGHSGGGSGAPQAPADHYAGLPSDLRPVDLGTGQVFYGLDRAQFDQKVQDGVKRHADIAAYALEHNGALMPGADKDPGITVEEADKARGLRDAYDRTDAGIKQQIVARESTGMLERAGYEASRLGAQELATTRMAESRDELRQQYEARDLAQEAYQATYQKEQDRRMGEIEKLTHEVNTTEVDPDRFWSKGGGMRAFAMLGLALGGFVEGFTHGAVKNRAAEMLSQAVDRDIRAQQASISNKRQGIRDMQGIYGVARERFRDDRMAEQYAREQLYRSFQMRGESLMDAARGESDRARIREVVSVAREKADELHLGLKLSVKAAADEAARMLARMVMQGAAGNSDGWTDVTAKDAHGGRSGEGTQGQLVEVDGQTYQAPSAHAANEMATASEAWKSAEQLFDDMEEQLKGGSALGTEGMSDRRATYNQDKQRLVLQVIRSTPGMKSDTDAKRVGEPIPEIARVWSTNELKRLQHIRAQYRAEHQNWKNSRVSQMTPVEERSVRNDKGATKRQFRYAPDAQPEAAPEYKSIKSDRRAKRDAKPANTELQDAALRALRGREDSLKKVAGKRRG